MWHDFNGGMWGFGWIFMILFWAVIVLAIVALGKWVLAKTSTDSDTPQSALEILEVRYARGELGRKEFEKKRHDLMAGR